MQSHFDGAVKLAVAFAVLFLIAEIAFLIITELSK
jgi:hypothetical protein